MKNTIRCLVVFCFLIATSFLFAGDTPPAYKKTYYLAFPAAQGVTVEITSIKSIFKINNKDCSKTPFQATATGNITVTSGTSQYAHFLFTVTQGKNTNFAYLFMDMANGAWGFDSNYNNPYEDICIGAPNSKAPGTIPIGIPIPSKKPVPAGASYPALNPASVYLVDYQKATDPKGASCVNLFFRGNEPLDQAKAADQKIDFKTLDSLFKSLFSQLVTDGSVSFPSSYTFIDVSLLTPGQAQGLTAEARTFGCSIDLGNTETLLGSLKCPVSDIAAGQIICYPINPGTTPDGVPLVTKLGKWLKKYMNSQGTVCGPVILYVHCAAGHDRTDMATTAYLYNQYPQMPGDNIFIYGTTVKKLGPGNTASQYAINLEDYTNPQSGVYLPKKSRIYPISSDYTTTIKSVLNGKTINSKCIQNISGNTGYGLKSFPWTWTPPQSKTKEKPKTKVEMEI